MSQVNTALLIKITGISLRQVNHWVEKGYLKEGNPDKVGVGVPRWFTIEEVGVARRMGALVRAGVSAQTAALCARKDHQALGQLRVALSLCGVRFERESPLIDDNQDIDKHI